MYIKQFEKGDRVIWTYNHSLNSRSRTKITKHGVFVRFVKRKPINGFNTEVPNYGMVKFDGNKTLSKIALFQLKYEQMTKRIYRG